MIRFPYYNGRGGAAPSSPVALPCIDPGALRAPEGYLATTELAAAVDVALMLGMPLLLTGEPGSGKSGLADSLAHELGLGKALRFAVKSDTEARDLFYRFDTLGRFHASQTRDADADPRRYIRFEALGKALLLAKTSSFARETLGLPERALEHPDTPQRSVVLIDEIDKASRDVPNDILGEIERMEFEVPELSGADVPHVKVALEEEEQVNRPIVIFTSNSEKALPDPFIRRCVYHNLVFPRFESELAKTEESVPRGTVTVEDIVETRLGKRFRSNKGLAALVQDAIGFFHFLRLESTGLERRPSLAELLDWLDYLLPSGSDQDRALNAEIPLSALTKTDSAESEQRLCSAIATTLLKRPADQDRVRQLLDTWLQEAMGQTG